MGDAAAAADCVLSLCHSPLLAVLRKECASTHEPLLDEQPQKALVWKPWVGWHGASCKPLLDEQLLLASVWEPCADWHQPCGGRQVQLTRVRELLIGWQELVSWGSQVMVALGA